MKRRSRGHKRVNTKRSNGRHGAKIHLIGGNRF